MFPKNSNSARGIELQAKLAALDLTKLPILNQNDFTMIGMLIAMFGYVDFHLKRLADGRRLCATALRIFSMEAISDGEIGALLRPYRRCDAALWPPARQTTNHRGARKRLPC